MGRPKKIKVTEETSESSLKTVRGKDVATSEKGLRKTTKRKNIDDDGVKNYIKINTKTRKSTLSASIESIVKNNDSTKVVREKRNAKSELNSNNFANNDIALTHTTASVANKSPQNASAKTPKKKIIKDIDLSYNKNEDVASTSTVKVENKSIDAKDQSLQSMDSSSEEEWEEVEENLEQNIEDYKPNIPKEGVEITIDCPELKSRRRQKKEFDENEYIRLYINRIRKDNQLNVHKIHLLCLVARSIYVNKLLNSEDLKGLALSLIPEPLLISPTKITVHDIEKIVDWFRSFFVYEPSQDLRLNVLNGMLKCFMSRKVSNASEYNMMIVVIARAIGLKARLCISLYPVSYKAKNLIKKPNGKIKNTKNSATEGSTKAKKETLSNKPKPSHNVKKKPKLEKNVIVKKPEVVKKMPNKLESLNMERKELIKRPRRSKEKSYKISSDEDENDDDDFKPTEDSESDVEYVSSKPVTLDLSPKANKSVKRKSSTLKKNRKVLSSDSESSSSEKVNDQDENTIDCWTEIYSKKDGCWIPIECVHNLVNKPYEIESVAAQPVTYILAIDNNSYVKDVTRRYCSEFMIVTRKLRVCSEWWEDSLEPFMPPNTKADKEEENKLEMILANKPMPTTISGFKNHPLYALKRHLLKFEAIYPPDAPSIGFIRKEPVYARDCVHNLHSRETWLKEARVVRVGEEPYKIVKARPKWDRIACELKTDLPLEIFGEWQTKPYEPPEAKDGKIPRNEYGNVELFKPCMIPKGTVHLQLPGLNRVAKKLGIDCCPAVVGFDGHKGSVHAVFDGFIVCKEFKDTLLAAWDEDQENARKREEEKREKRIYGNWRRLIKGLLIRERIKTKYNVK